MSVWERTLLVLQQTASNLWRNRLRSFLTMFGIAWGIGSLVLMTALCDGFRQGQRKNMKQLGDSIVMVWGGRTELQAGGQRAGRWVRLHESDLDAIRQQCPVVSVVAGEIKKNNTPVASAYNSGRFLVLGVTPEYLQLRNLPVADGRHISEPDVREGRRVCILGSSVRKQLFGDRAEAIGQGVEINGYPYQVVGLMSAKEQNSSYDGWDNEKVLIPATSLRRDCPPNRQTYAEGRLGGIIYRPASVAEWKTAQEQVRRALGRKHGFDPADKTALPMWDTLESAELFDKVFDATEIFLAAVALVTLVLGGVGVMNTMMSAVAERTAEIGLKKALGATSRRILSDFFLEGVLLALLSGGAGLAIIAALAAAVNSLPMPTMFAGLPIDLRSALLALASLGAVAVISAIPPAWRASRLTPIEALRYER